MEEKKLRETIRQLANQEIKKLDELSTTPPVPAYRFAFAADSRKKKNSTRDYLKSKGYTLLEIKNIERIIREEIAKIRT